MAAAGLLLIVTGATVITLSSEGVAPARFPLTLALLCAWVAYGRWPRNTGRDPQQTSTSRTNAQPWLWLAVMMAVFVTPSRSEPVDAGAAPSGTLIVRIQFSKCGSL